MAKGISVDASPLMYAMLRVLWRKARYVTNYTIQNYQPIFPENLHVQLQD